MSINADSEPSTAESPAISPAKFDFAKYRSDELAESLAELISVPGRFLKVIRTTAVAIVLAVIACYLIRTWSELSLIPFLLVCAYSLVISVWLGVNLGVLRVISTALQNIESILKIVLEKTVEVAQDYDRTRSGELELPTCGELVELVYREVLVPVLERVVSRSFYFLAKPIRWCYRRTIGAALHKLVSRANRSSTSRAQEQESAAAVAVEPESSESYVERVVRFTSRALDIATNLGRRLRTLAMLPLYIALGVSLTIAAIPVVVTVYYFG